MNARSRPLRDPELKGPLTDALSTELALVNGTDYIQGSASLDQAHVSSSSLHLEGLLSHGDALLLKLGSEDRAGLRGIEKKGRSGQRDGRSRIGWCEGLQLTSSS